jgi:hypothetical protein
VEKARENLQNSKVLTKRAVKEALHRVGAGMKTDAVKETTRKYFLSASDIRKHMLYRKISGDKLSVELIVKGARRDISEYKVTGKGKNLLVAVKRTGMKKLRTGYLSTPDSDKGRKQITDKNGRPVVLWRPMGEGQDPVKRVKTLSIPQAVRNEETVKTIIANAHERFEKRLDQNVDRMIRGSWKG